MNNKTDDCSEDVNNQSNGNNLISEGQKWIEEFYQQMNSKTEKEFYQQMNNKTDDCSEDVNNQSNGNNSNNLDNNNNYTENQVKSNNSQINKLLPNNPN
jgi:hypothetical protein